MPSMKALAVIIKTLWPLFKFYSEEGQRSQSRSKVQNLWYHWIGLIKRNTHAKNNSFISKDKKVMVNVNDFFSKEGQGQGHMFKRR